MTANGAVPVGLVDPALAHAAVRAVRRTVAAGERDADAAGYEWDGLDPLSLQALAQDPAAGPVGAARLAPDRSIARLAVRPDWRGRGIGSDLLRCLIEAARARGWPRLTLQPTGLPARRLAARHGFLPAAAGSAEPPATWQRRLDGPMAVTGLAAAVAASTALIAQSRRRLAIYSRALDPGLLDSAEVIEALRRFATSRHDKQVRVLLQDAASPTAGAAPLLRLAQRLPSAFQLRLVDDPVDAQYPSAHLVGDGEAYYFRPSGRRYDDGETWLLGAARGRQIEQEFLQVWERSAAWTGHRALGL